MQNRFTFRDLVYVALFLAILVSIWIKMAQDDRQWRAVQDIGQKLDQQARTLAQVLSAQGMGVAPAATGPAVVTGAQDVKEPAPCFDRLQAVMKRDDFARGDWFVDAFGVQPPTLTPLIGQDVYAAIVNARVLECLACRNPDTFAWTPMLATSWTTGDGGKTITFELRRGVHFSDGEPFTADDVVFTYDLIMNPKIAAQRERSDFIEVESVRKTGEYEVVFRFKRPFFHAFELAGGMDILPKHFYEKFDPEKFNESTGLLMGTGPYRLESPTDWAPGKQIVLVRNERYWGVANPFDRLVYKVILTDAAGMIEFKNQSVDVFGAQPEQYDALVKDPRVMAWADCQRFYSIRAGYHYIAWNQKRKGEPTVFANAAVRKAMTLLTNRQEICDSLYEGHARIATGPFNPLSDQCDKTIAPWPYDVAQARALLRQAGFEDRDGSGVLTGPDGKPFKVKITYPAKSEFYDRIMKLIQDCYARAGVNVELDPCDWPILTQKLTNRDFDAISLGWSSDIENDIYQMFHSSQIADNGDDFMSYANPELDRLIEKARATTDEGQRMALWRQCHRIIHEDQPYTFLAVGESLFFHDKRIHNVQKARAGLNFVALWETPMEWYVPGALQKYGR
jgi:peptide/nickel transport system substrate-binding protein